MQELLPVVSKYDVQGVFCQAAASNWNSDLYAVMNVNKQAWQEEVEQNTGAFHSDVALEGSSSSNDNNDNNDNDSNARGNVFLASEHNESVLGWKAADYDVTNKDNHWSGEYATPQPIPASESEPNEGYELPITAQSINTTSAAMTSKNNGDYYSEIPDDGHSATINDAVKLEYIDASSFDPDLGLAKTMQQNDAFQAQISDVEAAELQPHLNTQPIKEPAIEIVSEDTVNILNVAKTVPQPIQTHENMGNENDDNLKLQNKESYIVDAAVQSISHFDDDKNNETADNRDNIDMRERSGLSFAQGKPPNGEMIEDFGFKDGFLLDADV